MIQMVFCAASLICFSFLLTPSAKACTDFRVLAKDNTIIIARSIDFSENLNSTLRTIQRGAVFSSVTPAGKPGLSWKSKYGYIAIDAMNATITLDGMNEKGLSFEYLFLPGENQYQNIPADKDNQAIPYFFFGDWVLGNFETVDQLRNTLQNVRVFSQKISQLGDKILPLHASITDMGGNSIVVEFVDGKMNVYENKLGVITNSPIYDWHLVNLRGYLDLSPYSQSPVVTEGMTFIASTQAAGMTGLPGDYSSPSRFVRTALMLATAIPAENAAEGLTLAQHIMNSVDISKGSVRAKSPAGEDIIESSQWAVFKNIKDKVIYYRTYDDLTLRSIGLAKIDFTEKAATLKLPMNLPPTIMDITDQFKATAGGKTEVVPAVAPGPVMPPASDIPVAPVTPVVPVVPAAPVTPVTPAPAAVEVVPVVPVVPAQ